MIGKQFSQQKQEDKRADKAKSQGLKILPHQFYQKLFKQWMQYQPTKQQKMCIQAKNLRQYQYFYSTHFKKAIIRTTSLQIIFDKCSFKALANMLHSIPFLRITNQPSVVSSKKIERTIGALSLKSVDNAQKLMLIAYELKQNKFISEGMFAQLQQMMKPKNSIQSKIQRVIKQASQLEIGQKEKAGSAYIQMIQQIWDSNFNMCSMFNVWNRIIIPNVERLTVMRVERLYHIYKPILSKKEQLGELYKKLRILLQFHSLSASQVLEYNIFHDTAKFGWHHDSVAKYPSYGYGQTSSNCHSKFQDQLKQLYQHIQAGIQAKNQKIRVNFQLFGSARSGFKLDDSDVDVALFCKQDQNNLSNPIQILRSIEQYLKSEPLKHYVNSIEFIQKARVPVIKLQLNNKIIKSADIVLNNYHGVQNSKFLQHYSLNPKIKMFCLLIKKWAKCCNLIGPKKFSSYALLLMSLFYLIKFEKLKPAQRTIIRKSIQQKQNEVRRGNRIRQFTYKTKIKANAELQGQLDLYQNFVNFLCFYSKDGYFSHRKQTLCLLQESKPKIKIQSKNGHKGQLENEAEIKQRNEGQVKQKQQYYSCAQTHRRIDKNFYLINMHDPFDNGNPGRFPKQQQQQLYANIDRTLALLNSQNNNSISQIFRCSN